MGGSSIAAACADISTNVQNNRFPYSALLVNTNRIDLDKIDTINPNTQKMIIGSGKGAGRNIKLGEQMYQEDAEIIGEAVQKQFSNTDFVWIVVGLGGGTGTGSVIEAIRTMMENGFKKRFGLIMTLPRSSEGQTVLNNALQRLQKINGAMAALGSIILVDNQKLYSHFSKNQPTATVSEYLSYSNNFIAETLHELNVVTSSFNPVGENHFDVSEFENLIKTPGVLHFARFTSKASELDSAQSISHAGRLKDQINEGVLSEGYDLSDATRLAVSILANKPTANRLFNFEFVNAIESEVNELAPFANEKPVAHYVYQNKDISEVYFYAVFAGLKLPKRVGELVQEGKRLARMVEEKQSNEVDPFADMESLSPSNEQQDDDVSFDDLFGDKKTKTTDDKKPAKDDDFARMFGN